jgi:predicted O-methyltransferase YrrM
VKLKRIPFFGRRIASQIRRYKLRDYRPEIYDAEEAQTWAASGLDFDKGLARYNAAASVLGLPPFDPARHSIHWVLGACIGQRFEPRRILELGTFTGQFTALLAHLYPQAEIVTVDLPDDDPLLRRMYGRRKPAKLQQEMQVRTKNLSQPNIRPVKQNSFFLLDAVQGPFDFIWVDAGHKFPDVAWDFCNAFHLVRPGGVMMADDVTRDPAFSNNNLGIDSELVLRYIADRTPSQLHYFMKRRDESAYLNVKEYVAWCEKPAVWPPAANGLQPSEKQTA